MRVAIPVEGGEGLDAVRSAHFGHAAGFALVDVVAGEPVAVQMLTNPPHEHGGCMLTVNMLASAGVDTVSAMGMGRGPLSGLLGAGIAVHHDPDSASVREAIHAIVAGRTVPFGGEHACRGH